MMDQTLTCKRSQRRQDAFAFAANGIDFLDAYLEGPRSEGPRGGVIEVYFFRTPPSWLSAQSFHVETVDQRAKLTVTQLEPQKPAESQQTRVKIHVSDAHPQQAYRLKIVPPRGPGMPPLDPQQSEAEFTFTPSALTETDFQPRSEPARATRLEPAINYLAKDYASFRQLVLDRLAIIMPGWRERHAADLGMALVEVLAFTGDRLSYLQDAVATEAYLETARRRISVRRHARLVDYQVHEGCNARTYVQIQAGQDASFDPHDVFFITKPPPEFQIPETATVLREDQLPEEVYSQITVFEPLVPPRRGPYIEEEDLQGELDVILQKLGIMPTPQTFPSTNGAIQKYVEGFKAAYNKVPPVDALGKEDAHGEKPEDPRKKLVSLLNQVLEEEQLWRIRLEARDRSSGQTPGTPARYLARTSPLAANRAILDQLLGGALAFSNQNRVLRQFRAHNKIHFYTWSQQECWLPAGATKATLVDYDDSQPQDSECSPRPADATPPRPLQHLSRGDVLIFEEVRSPTTNQEADADPAHRQAVRLTRVRPTSDPVTLQNIVEIEWQREDALRFPLCISSRQDPPDCGAVLHVSVARGNVVLVDQGRTLPCQELGIVDGKATQLDCGTDCAPPTIVREPVSFQPQLRDAQLTFAQPIPKKRALSARQLLQQKPPQALPWIRLHAIPATPTGQTLSLVPDDLDPIQPERFAVRYQRLPQEQQYVLQDLLGPKDAHLLANVSDATDRNRLAKGDLDLIVRELQQLTTWEARYDLLASEATDRHFVAEIDDQRVAHLRFGDGQCGQRPATGTKFFAACRVGGGNAGNVGAGAIRHIVFRRNPRPYQAVTNPLPAEGGVDPQSLTEVKLQAPSAYQLRRERAIIAQDYVEIVQREFGDKVQQAQASLDWVGTYWLARVAIDPRASVGDQAAVQRLVSDVKSTLYRYRRIGHRVDVTTGIPVPLWIEMVACVRTGHLRTDVRRELTDLFSNRELTGDRRGLFHPDHLTFGQPVYLSQLIAAAKRVAGVENVQITVLRRAGPSGKNAVDEGVLDLGPGEIAQLDNDGDPSRGKFCLELRGGR